MSEESSLPERIVTAIRSVAGAGPTALHEPSFAGNEWLYLKECLDSTFVSSVGKFVDRFESELAQFAGAKHAVAVVNGTAALHIALKLAGVQAGDEVLMPALTFVATANAVAYCGAIPHLVDSDERTLGVDPEKLRDYLDTTTEQYGGHCINRITRRVVRAIVPMHTFGHPVAMEALQAVARDFNLPIIEDAAESLGSTYRGRHTGTFGRMGVLSFNGNKTITTGGGGALLTDDASLARHAKHLTTTAKIAHPWEYRHDEIGYNYRMPNLNAALGCAQLEQLPALLSSKRELFRAYQTAFMAVDGVRLMAEPEGCVSNYWLQTLILEPAMADQRDAILRATNSQEIMTRPVWLLMQELAPFQKCPRMDLASAQLLARRIINIPSSAGLIMARP
jgi:aminotransferase in exopolysaccharide biosynthesis